MNDEKVIVKCEWCGNELDLNQTDWCDNCDTSIFDDKCNKPQLEPWGDGCQCLYEIDKTLNLLLCC